MIELKSPPAPAKLSFVKDAISNFESRSFDVIVARGNKTLKTGKVSLCNNMQEFKVGETKYSVNDVENLTVATTQGTSPVIRLIEGLKKAFFINDGNDSIFIGTDEDSMEELKKSLANCIEWQLHELQSTGVSSDSYESTLHIKMLTQDQIDNLPEI